MSKIKRILLTILLPFSMLFVFIGYASLSKNFTVGGSVEIKPGKYVGVYISDVKVISTNNIYNNHYNYSKPTNFNCVNTINSANSTITYEITLHNNSDVTYYYLGVDYVKNYNSNSLINVTNGIFINTYDLKDSTSSYFDESM